MAVRPGDLVTCAHYEIVRVFRHPIAANDDDIVAFEMTSRATCLVVATCQNGHVPYGEVLIVGGSGNVGWTIERKLRRLST